MGIFSDNAQQLWDCGFSIIPVSGKRPIPENWDSYRESPCSEKILNQWIKKHPKANIGLVTGAASKIAVIDIDIKNEPELLNKAKALLPRSPLERFGKKGIAIFVRFENQLGRKIYYKGKQIGDFIVSGQVVIPPSIHPETKKPYKWVGYGELGTETANDLFDELPKFDDTDLSIFEKQLGAENVSMNKEFFEQTHGRNDRLKFICLNYLERGFLPEKIAPMLLAEDYNTHGDKPLFEDPHEFKMTHKNPLASAYLMASSLFKTYLKSASMKGVEIPNFSLEKSKQAKEEKEYHKYFIFFEEALKNTRRDKIDGILKARGDHGFWKPVGNKIKVIKSHSTDFGLSAQKVEHHFQRYESNRKKEWLFEMPKWDGRDHIAEICSFLACSNLKQTQMAELLKSWFSGIFARVNKGDQNQMIILHGAQGRGKDILISHLCSGFKPYFSNYTDAFQEKDLFMQLAKNLVINVSEFDRLNRMHPGLIKDLISREHAQFRPSHQQHFEDFKMNSSFIGSTNHLDFLTDTTGNRRFWVFADMVIDWKYPKDRMGQIVAQSKQLYDDKFECPSKTLKLINSFTDSISPENTDEMVIEIWNSGLEELAFMDKHRVYFSRKEVTPVAEKLRSFLGFNSTKRAMGRVGTLGGRASNDENGARYQYIGRRVD